MSTDIIVVQVDKARALLAQAKNAPQAKQIVDMAHAAEVYAKRQKLSQDAIDYAHAVRIDATALLGKFQKVAPKNEGGRPLKTSTRQEPVLPTLADIGISKKESANAQELVDIAEGWPVLNFAFAPSAAQACGSSPAPGPCDQSGTRRRLTEPECGPASLKRR